MSNFYSQSYGESVRDNITMGMSEVPEGEPIHPEPISPAAFADAMRAIMTYEGQFGIYDTEEAHGDADDLMCKLLKALGYRDGVEVYEGMDKWYA